MVAKPSPRPGFTTFSFCYPAAPEGGSSAAKPAGAASAQTVVSSGPTGPVPSGEPMDLEAWKTRIAQAEDLPALMKEAMKMTDAVLQQKMVASVIDRWLVVDAKGFVKFLKGLEVGAERPRYWPVRICRTIKIDSII